MLWFLCIVSILFGEAFEGKANKTHLLYLKTLVIFMVYLS